MKSKIKQRIPQSGRSALRTNRKPTSSDAAFTPSDKTVNDPKSGIPLPQTTPVAAVTSPSVAPPVSASVCSYDGTVFSMKSEVKKPEPSNPTGHGKNPELSAISELSMQTNPHCALVDQM